MAKRHCSREAACLTCGASFLSYSNGKSPTGWTQCCSVRCAQRRRQGIRPIVVTTHHWHCEHCGKAYHLAHSQKSKYCGYECAKRAIRTKHAPRPCKVCSREFTPAFRWGPPALCCSAECDATRVRRNKRAGSRVGKAKRRARLRGVEAQAIDPIKVFERDKWRCHLCKCKTCKDKRGTYDDKAPELDHIVALADGGAHTWGNVACACRKCNGLKGARSMGQLGLPLAA